MAVTNQLKAIPISEFHQCYEEWKKRIQRRVALEGSYFEGGNVEILFSVGYVKALIYADKPQTLDPLEDNIGRVIADIRPQILEKVIENWTSRLDYIRASRGSSMP
ncbi:hypothetical protein TNCV_931521 [Trichonephila clavipes]|uniref:Uncharacterized protein n=1 Tax=Trichonephila clavipes TaxID=2585209 RepID=A0A8X6W3B1_TRICX|nr:hypothetical protein TNCV_931521 [Trichonephila clavipes]